MRQIAEFIARTLGQIACREKCVQRIGCCFPELGDLQEIFVRSCSLDRVVFAESGAVLPYHTYFFSTQTCVFDRHAEELVFILLVVGGQGVLVK